MVLKSLLNLAPIYIYIYLNLNSEHHHPPNDCSLHKNIYNHTFTFVNMYNKTFYYIIIIINGC